jgi:dihydrofolate reductase
MTPPETSPNEDARVVWHTMMSLDGFIAGPDDAMDWAFRHSGSSEMAEEVRRTTGAILAGRRWHDVAIAKYDGRSGIYGGNWEGPVFVLTHHPPKDPPDPEITFLSDGIEDAVSKARAAAGPRNLEIFGADIARQTLEAGLLDHIAVHIAPVLLGDGVRFFGSPGADPVELERIELDGPGQITDLRFRVVR